MTAEPGRSRAVLFGVHEFRDMAALDGVRLNVPALRALLTSEDVGGLAAEDCTVVPHDGSQQRMLDDLHDAAREATDLLLVYYAGHGHFGGGGSFRLATRESSPERPYHSVKYDEIRDLVQGSPAARKVVIVDCCFSGRALPMSDEQVPTALDTEISGACVLTSAAETQRSLCLPEGSVFTLELTRLLTEGLSGELPGGRRGEHLPDLTMTDVFGALNGRLRDRTVEGRPVPQPRMSTRDLGHQIVLARNRAYAGAPDPEAAQEPEDHEWVTATRDHPLWNYVTDPRGLSLLRDTATALAARAAAATARDHAALADDPWTSASFVDRLAEWTDSLLLDSSLRPDDLELSAAEVFLLVTHPYLHAAFRRHTAARYAHIDPTDLTETQSTSTARGSYEVFLRGQPRLVRRARGGADPAAADAIGWWLFHRWLARQPRPYEPSFVAALLDDLAVPPGTRSPREKRLVGDVLEPSLISRLLRAPHLSRPPRDTASRPLGVGAAETAQLVREDQLSQLLRVAHLFSVDPVALPDVLVQHIGVGYAVDLPALHDTLAGLRWQPHGRTRVLSAACRHLAVELGLRQHTAALDTVLARLETGSGGERPALLRNLPLHVTADRVTPAHDEHGRPAYEPTELRFRLADDRVQELLMGVELYGDPALAVRELYQNALDACRYRRARTAYLRATGSPTVSYEGEIAFTQGVDEEGPYLECRDNGVGMGEAELRDVFAHAGMRFTDLPEYAEEQAKWKKHGISLYPNSQFGVGVLSYFMLADDITVTTCRFTPEGLPGEHLRVEIAGPGSLFRIQRLDPCHEAYTSIRLRLRSPGTASCVEVLRSVLWISEFAVTARDDRGDEQVWRADVLSDAAPLREGGRRRRDFVRDEGAVAIGSSTPAVWWCNTGGAVLADGLWAGTDLFGAVVNLSGAHTPRLTVNRGRIVAVDADRVEGLLRREIPSLVAAGDTVLRHGWLASVLEENARLADEVFAEAVRVRFAPWRIGGREVDITKCGFFAPDEEIYGPPADARRPFRGARYETVRNFRTHPLTHAGLFPELAVTQPPTASPPIPSDIRLLVPQWHASYGGFVLDRTAFRHYPAVSLGVIAEAVRVTGRPAEEVGARLRQLGFTLPATSVPPSRLDADDLRLISEDARGSAPWVDPGAAVNPAHVTRAADTVGQSVDHVVSRLTELGYRVADTGAPWPEPDDLSILSVGPDGLSPWHSPDTPIRADYVERASERTGRSVEEISRRLHQLGWTVAPPRAAEWDGEFASLRDIEFELGWGLIGQMNPRLGAASPPHTDTPVSTGDIVYRAIRTKQSTENIIARLGQFGFISRDPVPALEPDDRVILSQEVDGHSPWLAPEEPVDPVHILQVSWATERTFRGITLRLHQLGYHLPDRITLVPEAPAPAPAGR
ncbi:caspase family protein [Streptomyces sp. NPDC050560]|uniref:caspase, EACC1-associated type n=1 Tax=Streptomyces sp. NPDC050560 TaxID=3365630 RepID=UPI0037B7766D